MVLPITELSTLGPLDLILDMVDLAVILLLKVVGLRIYALSKYLSTRDDVDVGLLSSSLAQ
jgi:hypothetical protein